MAFIPTSVPTQKKIIQTHKSKSEDIAFTPSTRRKLLEIIRFEIQTVARAHGPELNNDTTSLNSSSLKDSEYVYFI